jgi:predicted O-methyltransferase YrrM
MNQDQWTAVDRYLEQAFALADPALDAAIEASRAAGMPQIQVAPNQGRLLQLLALANGSRHILEIGTLAGYSTIWLARALPTGGRLVTLELDPKHAAVAAANLARASVAHLVDLRVGPAIESLRRLASEGAAPFDLVFVDADKAGMPAYFEWSLKLAAPGALLVFDNVVRDGAVADPASADPSVRGVRRLHEMLAAEPRVLATTIQTVGVKGWDGLTIARVADRPREGGAS